MAKITIDTDDYALVFLQKDAGDQWQLYQDGKEQIGAQSVDICAERDSLTRHSVSYTTGLEKAIKEDRSAILNQSNELLHPKFLEELSKFDTAILRKHKDKNGLVIFNNGDLNRDISSVLLTYKSGYSEKL